MFNNFSSHSVMTANFDEWQRQSKPVYDAIAEVIIDNKTNTIKGLVEGVFNAYDLKDKRFLLLSGVSEKGDNRDEQREVIVANLIQRLMHEIYNISAKILSNQLPEENLSK